MATKANADDPVPLREEQLLAAEDGKWQGFVSLADGKIAILAGFMATVISLVGVVAALLIGQMRIVLTGAASLAGLAAALCFFGAVFSFAYAMWPRTRGLPNDKTPEHMRCRIQIAARQPRPNTEKYRLVHGAQQISHKKNRAVRYTIVFLVSMVMACGAMFALLLWPLLAV